jgi:hypothetical protein
MSNTSIHLLVCVDEGFKSNLPIQLYGTSCEFFINTRPKFLTVWHGSKYFDGGLKTKQCDLLIILNAIWLRALIWRVLKLVQIIISRLLLNRSMPDDLQTSFFLPIGFILTLLVGTFSLGDVV